MGALLILQILLSLELQPQERGQVDPKLPPPTVCVAEVIRTDDGLAIRLTQPVIRAIDVQRIGTTLENNRRCCTITRERGFTTSMENYVLLPVGDVKISRRKGNLLVPAEPNQIVNKRITVVVFSHGEVDPFYLQVVREEALVIVINRTALSEPWPN
jgi:hypothetical protein